MKGFIAMLKLNVGHLQFRSLTDLFRRKFQLLTIR